MNDATSYTTRILLSLRLSPFEAADRTTMRRSSFLLIVAVFLTMGQYHTDCKFLIHPYNSGPTILINFADTLPIFRVRPSSMTRMFVNTVLKLKFLSFANIFHLLKN